MTTASLPCGCLLEWNECGTDIALCDKHDLQYGEWNGTDEEFFKIVVTPKINTSEEQKYEQIFEK